MATLPRRQRVKDARKFFDAEGNGLQVELYGATGTVVRMLNVKLVEVQWETEPTVDEQWMYEHPETITPVGSKASVDVTVKRCYKLDGVTPIDNRFAFYVNGKERGQVAFQPHTWKVVFIRIKGGTLPEGCTREKIAQAIDRQFRTPKQVLAGYGKGQGLAERTEDDAVVEYSGLYAEEEDLLFFRDHLWDECSMGESE